MANENNKNSLGKAAYCAVVIFSLAVIGSVSWFTVSKLGALGGNQKSKNDTKNNSLSSYSSEANEYNKKENEPKTDGNAAEETAKPQNEEPYQSNTQAESATEFTMPAEGAIIKPFSSEELQYSSTYNDMRLHEGIDIKCAEGTPVKSAAKGTVTEISDDAEYGKTVIIDHGNGIRIKYCGLKTVAVTVDSEVGGGEEIGTSGNVPCECKDEPHIHLEAADESGLTSIMNFLNKKTPSVTP